MGAALPSTMIGSLVWQDRSVHDGVSGDIQTAAAAAAAVRFDDLSRGHSYVDSDEESHVAAVTTRHSPASPSSSSPSSSSSLSAYRHLRLRYEALRKAHRRQEDEAERSRAALAQLEAEVRQAAEKRCKEQRAVQQLVGQIAQLQEACSEERRRRERGEVWEQQLTAERSAFESQLSACREDCGRLQSELERQSEALAAERRKLMATVSRHARDESAQQRSIQALAQTVDELRAEAAGREAKREQLLEEMQALRDALQLSQLPGQAGQRQRLLAAPDPATAQDHDGLHSPVDPRKGLYLSPVFVTSPSIVSTPSAVASFVFPSARSSGAAAGHSKSALSSSPLDTQLSFCEPQSSHAAPHQRTATPRTNSSSTAQTSSESPTPSATSPLSASAVSSVVSPFSSDDFPPLGSSPIAATPQPRSAWKNRRGRVKSAQRETRGQQPRDDESSTTASLFTTGAASASTESSDTSTQLSCAQSTSRSLQFAALDDHSASDADRSAPPAVAPNTAIAASPARSASCAFCPHAAPPVEIIAPLTYSSPLADRTRELGGASATAAAVVSSTPCSSCQLRASSALVLTPASSSQRSLAVLDSEFRRVKRWTTQLQQHISHQQRRQQQQQQPLVDASAKDVEDAPLNGHGSHALAASFTPLPSLTWERATHRRSNSEPHRTAHLFDAPSMPPSIKYTERKVARYSPTRGPAPVQSSAVWPATPPPSFASPTSRSLLQSVSVSSLLVQLSLCDSELRAKATSLQAAGTHIAALHDKLSVMADSIEQMEQSADEQYQHAQQQHRRQAEEWEKERRSMREAARTAEQSRATLAEQCAALHSELREARSQAHSQHRELTQQSADMQRRCEALVGQLAALEARAELHAEQRRALCADVEAAAAQLAQHKQRAESAEQRNQDDLKEAETISEAVNAAAIVASPPLLQLIEQQFVDEMTELEQIIHQFSIPVL